MLIEYNTYSNITVVFFDYLDNHQFTRTTGMTHFKAGGYE